MNVTEHAEIPKESTSPVKRREEKIVLSIDSFRKIVGAFVTGVTVVTTRDREGRLKGFTANAFSSVSLDPPLILVCVGKDNDTHSAITSTEATAFTVNILSADQRELADIFARKNSGAKFDGIDYREEITGAPILDGVLAYIECQAIECFSGGDHTIVVGAVHSLGENEQYRNPLLFYRGSYDILQSCKSLQ